MSEVKIEVAALKSRLVGAPGVVRIKFTEDGIHPHSTDYTLEPLQALGIANAILVATIQAVQSSAKPSMEMLNGTDASN